ncbi:MAG: sigma-70 family RNA polymerase sigma factor, partial [Planctomycetota bacterium]
VEDSSQNPAPKRPQTFAEQWSKAHHTLGGFIRVHAPEPGLAEDIMQEVARQATENFDQYDPARPFSAWLVGIARQRIADAYRERGRRPMIFSSEIVDSLSSTFVEMQQAHDERIDGLRVCMGKLSERHRRVIELRYARQLSSEQIAEKVGCSTRAVTSMQQRIREALRKCVSQYLEARG